MGRLCEGTCGGETGEVAPGQGAEGGGGIGVVFEVVALGGEAGEDEGGAVYGLWRLAVEGGGSRRRGGGDALLDGEVESLACHGQGHCGGGRESFQSVAAYHQGAVGTG